MGTYNLFIIIGFEQLNKRCYIFDDYLNVKGIIWVKKKNSIKNTMN